MVELVGGFSGLDFGGLTVMNQTEVVWCERLRGLLRQTHTLLLNTGGRAEVGSREVFRGEKAFSRRYFFYFCTAISLFIGQSLRFYPVRCGNNHGLKIRQNTNLAVFQLFMYLQVQPQINLWVQLIFLSLGKFQRLVGRRIVLNKRKLCEIQILADY